MLERNVANSIIAVLGSILALLNYSILVTEGLVEPKIPLVYTVFIILLIICALIAFSQRKG